MVLRGHCAKTSYLAAAGTFILVNAEGSGAAKEATRGGSDILELVELLCKLKK